MLDKGIIKTSKRATHNSSMFAAGDIASNASSTKLPENIALKKEMVKASTATGFAQPAG